MPSRAVLDVSIYQAVSEDFLVRLQLHLALLRQADVALSHGEDVYLTGTPGRTLHGCFLSVVLMQGT